MRELWVSIAHTSGAKIYSMVLGVFSLFLTARYLGPDGRGQVAAITTWVNLFATFAHLSLGQVALSRMAGDREQNGFGGLLGSLLLMTAVLVIGGWLVAIGLHLGNSDGAFKGLAGWPLVVGFLALPFLVWEQYGSSLLMGMDQLRVYNRYQIAGRTVAVIVLLVLVSGLGMGVVGALGANLLGQVMVAVGGVGFMLSIARSKNTRCKPNKKEIKALLSGGTKLHLNAVGTFFFTSANILILNHYHGAELTGQFQLAMQLLTVLMIIPQAASMVIYGKVVSVGPNGAWPINRRLLLQLTLGMAALSVVAALVGPWGIVLLAGEPFRPSAVLFQWLLPGLVGMTFSTLMAPQWIARGYLWQAAALSALVGIANLGANFLLIPEYGAWGAIYAFLATYAFSAVANGVMALWCEGQVREQEREQGREAQV